MFVSEGSGVRGIATPGKLSIAQLSTDDPPATINVIFIRFLDEARM
jgi:hypothetical protein